MGFAESSGRGVPTDRRSAGAVGQYVLEFLTTGAGAPDQHQVGGDEKHHGRIELAEGRRGTESGAPAEYLNAFAGPLKIETGRPGERLHLQRGGLLISWLLSTNGRIPTALDGPQRSRKHSAANTHPGYIVLCTSKKKEQP
jgi:hypothetical protein